MAKIDRLTTLIYLTLLVNLLDIVLHVAIGQPEALRIISNTFIIISGALILVNTIYRMLFVTSLVLYIILNTLHVLLEGAGLLGAVLIATTVLTGVIIIRRRAA